MTVIKVFYILNTDVALFFLNVALQHSFIVAKDFFKKNVIKSVSIDEKSFWKEC